ncbi:GntR family transcriptional regulator [Salinisphaera sp. Q1T1-3]|uniref:GntR family transcriptional regulator n=1 Tax=Salinisphaera sp. Q1T1-3 TaxID=2321229 RepID=UPI000E73FA88|nr:GntR family transcriptional regulator [Salinisphaera sp. Q1T1-3]RJS93800.1 GntR family transcriptional regulator [Salinisphaera sp. Q1T1-3]
MSEFLQQSEPPTATDDPAWRIARSVRHAILNQQLPAGTRLPESRLAQVFAVNRAIVRKALVRLTADGILTSRRNQSATVAEPSREETAELFAARRLVECEVVRLTAGALSAGQRQALEKTLDDERSAHEAGAHDQRIHHSLAFHQQLAAACPNRVLAGMLDGLILRTSIAVALYKVPGMAACYREDDHRHIIEALDAGDSKQAAALMTAHLSHLEARLDYARAQNTVDLAAIFGAATDTQPASPG